MFCMQTINFETTQQDQESSWWLCMISFVTQNKNICIIWRLIAIMAKKFILTNHTKCSNFWSSLFKELFKIPVKTPRFRWCYVYGSWIIIVLVSAQGSGYKPPAIWTHTSSTSHNALWWNSEIYLFIALFFWSTNHSL